MIMATCGLRSGTVAKASSRRRRSLRCVCGRAPARAPRLASASNLAATLPPALARCDDHRPLGKAISSYRDAVRWTTVVPTRRQSAVSRHRRCQQGKAQPSSSRLLRHTLSSPRSAHSCMCVTGSSPRWRMSCARYDSNCQRCVQSLQQARMLC